MRIVEINQRQFDEYAITHKNRNFYQTSQYGEFMSRNGYKDFYLALMDFDGKIIAASLILVKRVFPNFKTAYSPRGFLIDFENFDLIDKYVSLLKDYLKKKRIISLKIDPPIEYIKRDNNGKPLPEFGNNLKIINYLGSIGFRHTGFNLYFENELPRWNSIIDNIENPVNIVNYFDEKILEAIKEAQRRGVVIYKGKKDDLKTLFNFLPKNKKFNYYYKLINIFSNFDMLDIFFSKIDPELFLKNCKNLYEKELIKNSSINSDLLITNNRAELLNQKMESDRLLGIYKKDVVMATTLFNSKNDMILSGSIVIKYGDEIFFFAQGKNEQYNEFNTDYLINKVLIEGFSKVGFKKFNLNGITGDFNPRNKYYPLFEFNKGFNARVVEYIGEFDLVLSKLKYSIYKSTHKKKDDIIKL